MKQEINLREILESTQNAHGQPDPILAMRRACLETLELAADNAEMIGSYSDPSSVESVKTNSLKRNWENKVTGFKVSVRLNIFKQSILDLKDKIK